MLISEVVVFRASYLLSNAVDVLSQSHRSNNNMAGPQEGHALPDERYIPYQSTSAAEHDEFSLR